jgi:hypothetical protein
MSKVWWTSLTVWLAVLNVVGFATGLVLAEAGVLELSPRAVAIVGIVDGVAMFALRYFRQNPPIAGSPPARRRRS